MILSSIEETIEIETQIDLSINKLSKSINYLEQIKKVFHYTLI